MCTLPVGAAPRTSFVQHALPAAPDRPKQLESLARHNPQAIFAMARAWPEDGLLAARFAERDEPQLHDPAFAAIAQRYRPYLPTLTGLSSTKLFERGRSIHRYFFYADDDGAMSFSSFLAQYQHAKAWRIEDKGAFVQIISASSQRSIEIYANKPMRSEEGTREIDQVLRQRSITPQVIVHRGHSSYADLTIARLVAGAAAPVHDAAGMMRLPMWRGDTLIYTRKWHSHKRKVTNSQSYMIK